MLRFLVYVQKSEKSTVYVKDLYSAKIVSGRVATKENAPLHV